MKLGDIKPWQYLYYTERYYGSDYADSLIHVRLVDGILMAHPICTNVQGEYINVSREASEDLPVSAYFDERCWYPTHYMGGDPSEFMTKNFPLAKIDNENEH